MYSVNLNLRVNANSYDELVEKIKQIAGNDITLGNWTYCELDDDVLSRENLHIGKVVRIKDMNRLGVVTKVNPKTILVSIGNGMQYNCPIETLLDVAPEDFKEEDLRLGRNDGAFTYNGYFGWMNKDDTLVLCFENRGKYDLIIVDTKKGTNGQFYKGLTEKAVSSNVKFTK